MKPAALFLGLAVVLAGCEKPRTPCVYEIPEGYSGLVSIEFGRSDCPQLPVKDGKLIFRIGKDGCLCTSSSLQDGWAKDEFYYVGRSRKEIPETGWGGGGLVWGRSTGSVQEPGQKEKTHEHFFIGTEKQFDRATATPGP